MPVKYHNPLSLFPQYQNYAHAIGVENGSRLLGIMRNEQHLRSNRLKFST